MATLEEHVIKVRHETDGSMERIRADARKAAQEIDQQFERAARGAGESADGIADDMSDAAGKSSEVWTGALRRIGEKLTDLGIKSVKATASYIADTFEAVRETDLFAQTLGVATTSMLALEKGFERARVPADNTREAVKTLRENLGEMARVGTGPAVDSLGSLGLRLEDLQDKNPEEQLKILADALQSVESESKRTSIAIELMGEDGQRIMPAMLDGAAGVDALTQAARDAGQVLDQETIEKTRELDEALMSMKGQAEGVALTVLEAVLPALTDAAEDTSAWVDENQDLIDQDLPAVIDAIATAMRGIGSAAGWAARQSAALGDSLFSFSQWASENKGILAVFAAGVPGGQALIPTILGNDTGGGVQASPEAVEQGERLAAERAAERERMQRGENLAGAVTAGRAIYDRWQDPDVQAEYAERQARAARASKFERGEKNKGKGKGAGKRDAGDLSAGELEIIADFVLAQPELSAEFDRVGGRFGATAGGLDRTRLAAAKSLRGGGNAAAARKAGLGTLGRLTDTANIEKQISRDPLSALFGVEALPDVSPADIAQDRAPQVLTATINNTFTIEQRFSIDGSSRPDLVPDQVTDAVRRLFSDEVERQSTYVANPFAR